MRLEKISFINHKTGWNVKDIKFGSLTLLVGASGVGKTQILKSISSLARIAGGLSLNGAEWDVEFEENGVDYQWCGRFEMVSDDKHNSIIDDSEYSIETEQLSYLNGDVIFSRNGNELIYNGQPTVKLDPSKSAVTLLKEEQSVSPVKKAFNRIAWLTTDAESKISIRPGLFSDIDSPLSLNEIKNLKFRNNIDRLFLIQKNAPETFNQIKDSFIDIFPLVEDIDFEIEQFFKNDIYPVLKIKEKFVDSWIKIPDISAGMCRTLSQIVALTLADDGDVMLIDEFENGLGINCIDQLAEMAIDSDIQIIMTSHHPYIINAIPYKDWRIVSRNGSNVFVNTASDLKIGEFSKHDAFMQLIQTPAYQTGQS